MKMSSKFFVIFILLLFLCFFSSDNVFPGWFRHYGGTGSDYSCSIHQSSAGRYIVGGDTNSYTYGGYDFAIYKLNSSGNKVWFKHYGGASNDYCSEIQLITGGSGGYVMAGSTSSYTHGLSDFAIYRLNSSGNKVWFKHYGGTHIDVAHSIQPTSDGGFIVAGKTESFSHGDNDFAIYKLYSSGNKDWFKHYGGSNIDIAYSIRQTSDGGYIVAGKTTSYTYGGYDFAIYKLNSNGNKVWFKHYGGTENDYALSIQQTSDGGYIVAGDTNSYTYGSYDFAIYKLNSIGNKVWFKHYGGSNDDIGRSIQQTSDGGYIVSGYTESYSYGNDDFAIYKLNSSGNKVWFKHYGGSNDDIARSIQQTSEGGYIVSGFTYSYSYGSNDFAIYKLDSNGNK